MNVHATGIVLAGKGVMLRGPSGSGKSLLALLLLDAFEALGQRAVLIADDQLTVTAAVGKVTMHAPQNIVGLIELRGRGIVKRPFVASARLKLVVDLVETLERMPEEDAFETRILDIPVPRCPVPRVGIVDSQHQLMLVREALRTFGPRPKNT